VWQLSSLARELAQLGHDVRLNPPAYVKPFVKRQKNDAADAEAICDAARRPNMRFVAVKSEEQQASGLVFRTGSPFPAWDAGNLRMSATAGS
jgi:transposase